MKKLTNGLILYWTETARRFSIANSDGHTILTLDLVQMCRMVRYIENEFSYVAEENDLFLMHDMMTYEEKKLCLKEDNEI